MAMHIDLTDGLDELIRKLAHCQDSKSSEQSFIGAIRVEIRGDRALLHVEEKTWETPSGDVIDTSWIKA